MGCIWTWLADDDAAASLTDPIGCIWIVFVGAPFAGGGVGSGVTTVLSGWAVGGLGLRGAAQTAVGTAAASAAEIRRAGTRGRERMTLARRLKSIPSSSAAAALATLRRSCAR